MYVASISTSVGKNLKIAAGGEKVQIIIAQIINLKVTLWKELIFVTEDVAKLNLTCLPLTSHSFKTSNQERQD